MDKFFKFLDGITFERAVVMIFVMIILSMLLPDCSCGGRGHYHQFQEDCHDQCWPGRVKTVTPQLCVCKD